MSKTIFLHAFEPVSLFGSRHSKAEGDWKLAAFLICRKSLLPLISNLYVPQGHDALLDALPDITP